MKNILTLNRILIQRIFAAAVLAATLGAQRVAQADDPSPAPVLDPTKMEGLQDFTQLSLEQLMNVQVTTLSRVSQRIDEAPGSVYSFDQDTLANRGYHSLGELLQVVPGFTVFHRDLQYVAGVRGLNANDNEKYSLLINGQNVNGMNEPDFLNGPINLDSARRVEVVVGPSSLFQQANTLAATVNVLTRDVEGTVVDIGSGNYLRYSGTAMVGHAFDADHNFTVSVTTENERGFNAFDSTFRPNLAGRDLVGDLEEPSYFAVAKGQYGELFWQVISYRSTHPELSIDSGSLNNDGQWVDEFTTGYLRWTHPISSTLTAVVSADADYKRQSRTDDTSAPQVNVLQQYLSQLTFDSDWSLQYTGIKNNLLQAGVQGSFDDNLDNWYTLNTPPDPVVPQTKLIDKNTYAVGTYVDDAYTVNSFLKFDGGFRFDRNSRLGPDRLYPGLRAAAILEPTDWWVSKVDFNRAVRFPSPLAALNDAWGLGKPGSPSWAALAPNATQPEILSTLEWQNIVYVDKNRLSLTIYHEELKDFISWFGPHTNVGNFAGNGAEFSVECPVTSKLTLWGNASYILSKLSPFEQYKQPNSSFETLHVLTNSSGQIIGSPRLTANAGLDYEFLHNVIFSPTVRYFSDQAAFDDLTGNPEMIRNRMYLDATLTWKDAFAKHLDLHAGVENLLNNRQTVGGQWLAATYRPRGISFVISMEMRF